MSCSTKYCRKPSAPHRSFCHSCIKKRYALKYPLKYFFLVLRQNAKRRGKEFTMSMSEFVAWAREEGFKPRGGSPSWPEFRSRPSIDRIDSSRGYSIDNIQVLTISENSIKGNRDSCPF